MRNHRLYRPFISCSVLSIRGAFFGFTNELVLTGWLDEDVPTPAADVALKTVLFANEGTRAAGLATAFLAVPCKAWKQ